jgi:hypothetical protein
MISSFSAPANAVEVPLSPFSLLTLNARKGNEAKIRFMNFLACEILLRKFLCCFRARLGDT